MLVRKGTRPNPMPLVTKTRKSVFWTIWISTLAAWLAVAGCSVDLSKLRPNHKDGSVPVVDAGGNIAVADAGSPANDAMTSDNASAGDLALRPEASADSTTVEAGQGTTPATDVGGQAADGSGPPNDAVFLADLQDLDAAGDGGPSQDDAPLVEAGSGVAVAGAADVGSAGVPDASPPAPDASPDGAFTGIPDASAAAPDAAPDTGPTPTVVNLSQAKPVTAAAQATSKEAIFGNDGSLSTSFCGAGGTLPVWWRVDLGATFNIVRTDVAFEKPASTYQYKIEVSTDDSTYTTVVDQSANTTRSGTLLSDAFTAQARYLRITILAVSPASASACFWEFSVWGYPSPGSTAASLANLALSGTAYRWYNNTSATANTNKVAEPMLNDNSVVADLNLAGTGNDPSFNAYEAAGVILAQGSTIGSVVFVSGVSVPSGYGDPDGNFTANFHLQLSSNGTTWTDAAGWTLAPAYTYNSTAANRDYVFSGSATGILGVRVIGLVHPDFTLSAYSRAREVQVWGLE